MYNFDVAPLPSHPLLDSILTPFNRVDINSHLSILLPTSSYKITDKSRGATLLLKDGNFRYAVPVVVFTTLPQELLDCIDVTGIRKLVCFYIDTATTEIYTLLHDALPIYL